MLQSNLIRNFFHNHNLLPITTLMAILVIFLYPLFHQGIPLTHDGEVQVVRFGAYMKAFVDGDIPPRWAGNLNYGYGIPVLNFYYPLPGYLATILYSAGFPLESGFKIISLGSFLLAPLLFYQWAKHHTQKRIYAWLVALFYGLAPYQLLNIYVRGDIAESLAFAIAPAVLLMLDLYQERRSVKYLLASGISLGFLILAHHGVSLMLIPLLSVYALIVLRQTKAWLLSFFTFELIGFGISAYFWIPALLEQQYTLSSMFIGNMYSQHFISLVRIFFAPWGYGADVNAPSGQAPQIGIATLFLLIPSIGIAFIKNKSQKLTAWLFLLMGLSGLLLVLPQSAGIWSQISLLKKYEFPWRFLGIPLLAFPCFITFFLEKVPKAVVMVAVAILLFQAWGQTKVNGYLHQDDSYYFSYPGTTFYHGETITRWSGGLASAFPDKPVEVIAGNAKVSNITKRNSQLTFTTQASTSANLLVNTLFYPGWKAVVNGKSVQIQFQDSNHRGLITFEIPPGDSHVLVSFSETKLRKIANVLSLTVGFMTITMLLIMKHKKSILSQ